MESKRYTPVGRCIYCNASRYSRSTEKLALEHIIPKGLGGRLLLPEASCHTCEKMTSSLESFCTNETLDAFRNKYGIVRASGRKHRWFPVEVDQDGKTVTKRIPITQYPAQLIMPLYPEPEVLLPYPLRRSHLHVLKPFPDGDFLGGPETEVFGSRPSRVAPRVYAKWVHNGMKITTGVTDFVRFAQLLAKVAHAYTVAEVGLGKFQPLLIPVIESDILYPAQYLVGGGREVPPAGDQRHEISLSIRRAHGRNFYVVRIRLFSNLGFPEYFCVSGLPWTERLALPMKMQIATPHGLSSAQRLTSPVKMISYGRSHFEYLCGGCENVLSVGQMLPDSCAIRCAKCGKWSLPYIGEAWTQPYCEMPDLEAPPEPQPRALWTSSP